ncbi:MAG: hypothetical protein H7A23_25770 [Leptospiraceae bacterium]|nr:hypothetical protein [Leptospiraceae bacterium]MCP5497977.1 hypothetical protein [Leptospiraceae bacterium]
MAIPKFRNHPIIKEFNGLKKFFRSHETSTSKKRVYDFNKFAELITTNEQEVAFDILGSVNFGQAKENSDTDLVIYLNCSEHDTGECDPGNCPNVHKFRTMLHENLKNEYGQSYSIEIVDCINLNQLDHALKNRDLDSMSLIRFGFYRSICRGINRKVLRKYEAKLSMDDELCQMIEASLADCFLGFIHSSQHTYSFKKYVDRLEEDGFKVPLSMAQKINSYLRV